VADSKNFFTLDFSREPGTIMNEAKAISASLDWASVQKPLSRMLEAFLGAAAGGHCDARLGSEVSLRAASLSEEILPAYQAAQAKWLVKSLLDPEKNDEDLRYALCEMGMFDHPLSLRINEDNLTQIVQVIKYQAQIAVSRKQLVTRLMDFLKLILNNIKTK
jgi:hypothetical protein